MVPASAANQCGSLLMKDNAYCSSLSTFCVIGAGSPGCTMQSSQALLTWCQPTPMALPCVSLTILKGYATPTVAELMTTGITLQLKMKCIISGVYNIIDPNREVVGDVYKYFPPP